MKNYFIFALVAGLFLLTACGSAQIENVEAAVGAVSESGSNMMENSNNGNGMMGMGGGMMARHHAAIPEDYAGLSNPISADEASIERGAELYTAQCASCHGDGGLGDGPAAANLDPVPANIAHTSQMLGDDYLYWRISEGGAMAPFNSTMIAWKGIMDEDARWDVINYVQALGSGQTMPRQAMGGAAFDPEVEAEKQASMLSDAVAQGVVTEEEAVVFSEAHGLVDGQMIQNRDAGMSGSMDNMMADVLTGLVASNELTPAQADTFLSVHDRLAEAGLMQ